MFDGFWSWFLAAGVLAYVLFDTVFIWKIVLLVNYATRVQKRIKPTETTTFYGMCLTQDVDFYLTHMNNARMTREMDVAMYQFFGLTGILEGVVKKAKNGTIWKTASTVRFRRPVSLFSIYKIQTKLVYWEQNCMYTEHQLLTRDNFVRAVALNKVGVSGVDLNELLQDFKKPEPSEELSTWVTSMECSSQKLRPVGAKSD